MASLFAAWSAGASKLSGELSGESSSHMSPKTSLSCASTGVRAIEMTTTMIRSLFSSWGSTSSEFARDRSTNANSPPWDISSPVRALSALVSPKSGPERKISRDLTPIRPTTSPMTTGHSSKSSCRLMEAPVVTKNSPRRIPRTARMSTSTCVRKLVSARSTPARKAPSVSLKPIDCVTTEQPVTVRRHAATKVSGLSAAATVSKTLRRMTLPERRSRPRKAIPLRASGRSSTSVFMSTASLPLFDSS
mmetsp:Transcript_22496/g.53815  ORF Transcript_22496/g.53815 Transcript_22496/m.53815 type:complete len:248 (+) Transcript_22496:932-1675(+)